VEKSYRFAASIARVSRWPTDHPRHARFEGENDQLAHGNATSNARGIRFTFDAVIINPEITSGSLGRRKISNGLDQKSKASSAKEIPGTRTARDSRRVMRLQRRDAGRWIRWMIIVPRYRLDILRKRPIAWHTCIHYAMCVFPLSMNSWCKKGPCDAVRLIYRA